MTNIVSASKKIQIEESRFKSAVSEALIQKMGGSINSNMDRITTAESDITDNENSIVSILSGAGLTFSTTTFSINYTASGSSSNLYTCPANKIAFVQEVVWTTFEVEDIGGGISYYSMSRVPIIGSSAVVYYEDETTILENDRPRSNVGAVLMPGDKLTNVYAAGGLQEAIGTFRVYEIGFSIT